MNRIIFVILLLTITFPAFGQDTLQNDLQKHFEDFNLVKLDKTEIIQKSKTGDAVQVAGFEFSISPRDLFVGADEVKTFRGKINGNPDSEIRLSVDEKGVKGYIFNGETRFYVESAAHFSTKASNKDHIIYKTEDRNDEQSSISLIDDALPIGLSMTESWSADVASKAVGSGTALRVIEIATDADYEFVTRLGGATQANDEILAIINMAEGVFERDLGLTFSVTFQHTWTTPDSYRIIMMNYVFADFRTYWQAKFPHIQRDAVHLFSAKPIVSGIADSGGICKSSEYSYGATGWGNFSHRWKVFAHEIGHNLDARHVEDLGDCARSLMVFSIYPLVEERFCQVTINKIKTHVNNYGSCLQEIGNLSKTKFDFDGDGKADVSVFRPSDGFWYIQKSSGSFSFVKWGLANDRLAPGDYDGDGRTDIAIYRSGVRNADGRNIWYILRSSDNTVFIRDWGPNAGLIKDQPVPADYDGDGKTDLAVYQYGDIVPSPGNFVMLESSTNSIVERQWGLNTDKLVPADYDGDGKGDVAVFRNGVWYILQSSNGATRIENFGLSTDQIVPADYDGDGKTDIAVWRPSTGIWYRINSRDNSFFATQFGLPDDKPTPADYDGDGRTDIAVFRPASGVWYLQRSTEGFTALPFGLRDDIPIPNVYVR